MKRLHKFLKVSVVLLFAIIFLASCSKNNVEKENIKLTEEQQKLVGNYFEQAFKGIKTGKDRKLTDEEVNQIKKVFVEKFPGSEFDGIVNITSNFFKAGSYNDPKEMDLDSFIKYFPSKVLEENSDEFKTTLEKLKKLDSFSEFELSAKLMPLVEIDKNLVDATLIKYAGIVSDDVKSKGMCLYLKEKNAYYTFVSDVSIGTFYPTEGEIKGNDLVLKCNYATLTLENKDGNYFIKSYIEK
ncbi:hypothetical protein [Finegoldia magna]|uniref:hypothetical protein n=1 Tax=Finegoldia magna TaxID=1260 RepID=UPI002915202A|nr:hypothetical protein [Finegoldia magna]MDU5923637.1 hypothetical protein [Finegoldia magna]MDU6599137.1 hypothetical protein [Finegoldia magna]